MPRMCTPFSASSLSAVRVFGGEARRGWAPCSTPNAEFSSVRPHPGVLLGRRGHRFERSLGAPSRRAHEEVVEVGDHNAVRVQLAHALGGPVVFAQGEKGRHQGITLLPAFALSYRVCVFSVVKPKVLRGAAVGEKHEW